MEVLATHLQGKPAAIGKVQGISANGKLVSVTVDKVLAENAKVPVKLGNNTHYKDFGDSPFVIKAKYAHLRIARIPELSDVAAIAEIGNDQDLKRQYEEAVLDLKKLSQDQFDAADIHTQISELDLRPLEVNVRVFSRVLNDIWHGMARIETPKNHGWAPEFARALRDAFFVRDQTDMNNVKAYLEKKGLFNQTFGLL